MSYLQLLAFLPSLFLSHSEMLLLLPTPYYLIHGDPLYLRAFHLLKIGFLFPFFLPLFILRSPICVFILATTFERTGINVGTAWAELGPWLC